MKLEQKAIVVGYEKGNEIRLIFAWKILFSIHLFLFIFDCCMFLYQVFMKIDFQSTLKHHLCDMLNVLIFFSLNPYNQT